MPRSLVLGTSILLILSTGCSKPAPKPDETKTPVVMNSAEGDILGRPEEPDILPVEHTETQESETFAQAEAPAQSPATMDDNASQDATALMEAEKPVDERTYMMTDYDTASGEKFHYDRRAWGMKVPVILFIKQEEGQAALYLRVVLSALLGDAAGSEVGSSRYIIRTDASRFILTKETPGLKTYSKTTSDGRLVWMEKKVTAADKEFMEDLAKTASVRMEVHSHFKQIGTALSAESVKALANVWRYYGEITPR